MSIKHTINNPVLDLRPDYFIRDPAVIYHEGTYFCYHTLVEEKEGKRRLKLGLTESTDLDNWSQPIILQDSELNFSSPGNVFRHKEKWYLCVQSYPINEGELWGSKDSRLWLMESEDLRNWSEPKCLKQEGCTAKWSKSHRQIDPYIEKRNDSFFCFYKTEGKIGVMISKDLESWVDHDEPVLTSEQMPDSSTIENPCIIHQDGSYMMFFTPCRPGRGMCMAKSEDLFHWSNIQTLSIEESFYDWAPNGPSAGMVIDDRNNSGSLLMFIHGEYDDKHGAALAVLKSTDLLSWYS
ncbi:glycoside hydrolase family protein [Vallitalea okinawensis]|uniref:hypothetical protein n=1 Tax=Vallitalea okinawensis TaxID=2078660 RepID=UPI000CFB26F4|nr:hypothetical protein [Vallitalea okinawensis]